MSDLGSRGSVHLYSENKNADQLRGDREADLRLRSSPYKFMPKSVQRLCKATYFNL